MYADASHDPNSDKSSQLGYIVMLHDDYNDGKIVHWSFRKSQRIAQSLAAEILAFSRPYDFGFAIRNGIGKMLM